MADNMIGDNQIPMIEEVLYDLMSDPDGTKCIDPTLEVCDRRVELLLKHEPRFVSFSIMGAHIVYNFRALTEDHFVESVLQ